MRFEVSQLPPVEFSPNWRGFWADRYKAGQVYQNAVYYSCVDVRNKGNCKPFDKATLNLTFVFALHRRRDRDNLIAMFKPGQDAIVDAGLIVDDDVEHLQIGKVDIFVDPERAPLTVIEIKEVKDETTEDTGEPL